MKMNCWDFKKCGRERGGSKTAELGVCPAATEARLEGIHAGKMAGRACWVVAGTLCSGREQGTFAQKYHNCEKCDFFILVKREEGLNFNLSVKLLQMIS